jgi:hypothetical protein
MLLSVRRVGWKTKQAKPAFKTGNKFFGLLRNMRRSAVNDEEDFVFAADQQPSDKLDENVGMTPPFSLIMNLIWPRELTTEIRLMR